MEAQSFPFLYRGTNGELREYESISIIAEPKEFQNSEFDVDFSTDYLTRKRQNEDFNLDITYTNSKSAITNTLSTHRELLIRRSSYFKSMLNFNLIETTTNTVLFTFHTNFDFQNFIQFKFQFKGFKTFIDYLYTGLFRANGDNVFDVFCLSRYLDDQVVAGFSIEFIADNFNCENLPRIRTFQKDYNVDELDAHINRYLNSKFDDVISKDSAVLEWSYDFFIEVITATELRVIREENVLLLVCRWLNRALGDRHKFMDELFEGLRFSFMTSVRIQAIFAKEDCDVMTDPMKKLSSIYMSKFELNPLDLKYHCERPRQYKEGMYFLGQLADNSHVLERSWPNNKCRPVQSLAVPSQHRMLTDLVALNDKLFMTGGYHATVRQTKIFRYVPGEVYDPGEDKWTTLKPMNQLRREHKSCPHEGKIYVFGGINHINHKAALIIRKHFLQPQLRNEVYDPATETWTLLPGHLLREGNNGNVLAKCLSVTAVRESIYLLYISEKDNEFRLVEYKPKTKRRRLFKYNPCLRGCDDAKLIGYEDMLFLVKADGEVVVYNPKCNKFHRHQVLEDVDADHMVLLYHDQILVRMPHPRLKFAVLNPKVVLDTAEANMERQMKHLWTGEVRFIDLKCDLNNHVVYTASIF